MQQSDTDEVPGGYGLVLSDGDPFSVQSPYGISEAPVLEPRWGTLTPRVQEPLYPRLKRSCLGRGVSTADIAHGRATELTQNTCQRIQLKLREGFREDAVEQQTEP